ESFERVRDQQALDAHLLRGGENRMNLAHRYVTRGHHHVVLARQLEDLPQRLGETAALVEQRDPRLTAAELHVVVGGRQRRHPEDLRAELGRYFHRRRIQAADLL